MDSFGHLSRCSAYLDAADFPECSKAEKLLGSGQCNGYIVTTQRNFFLWDVLVFRLLRWQSFHAFAVAEILLWRDEKTTFACFVISVLLFYWFFLSGRSFVSSTASLLLIITAVLYAYACLPLTLWVFLHMKCNLLGFWQFIWICTFFYGFQSK